MAVKFRDYYEVLGVPRTAGAGDIKKAYRRQARKLHPDLAPTAEKAKATEAFKELNEANEVLSDPAKRAKYDALGSQWKNGMDFTPPPGTRWNTGEASQWEDLEGFSDFFASIFGQAGATRRGRGRRVRMQFPGEDVEAELPVTVEELMRGGKRRISLGEQELDVEIPLGTRDGTALRLTGKGQPGTNGGPPGDLYLRLRLVPHARYRTVGEDDLEMDLPLWPWQAMLGAEVRVETPEGAVSLKVPPGTQNGQRMRLRGRGLPLRDGSRGDLYAMIRIVNPASPSEAEREAYEALKRAARAPADRPAEG